MGDDTPDLDTAAKALGLNTPSDWLDGRTLADVWNALGIQQDYDSERALISEGLHPGWPLFRLTALGDYSGEPTGDILRSRKA